MEKQRQRRGRDRGQEGAEGQSPLLGSALERNPDGGWSRRLFPTEMSSFICCGVTVGPANLQ